MNQALAFVAVFFLVITTLLPLPTTVACILATSTATCTSKQDPPNSIDKMPPSVPPANDLPRWNLEARFGFESPFDDTLDQQLTSLEERAKAFRQTYGGNLLQNGDDRFLCQAIQTYEEIVQAQGLISSYLSLSYDVKLDNDSLQKRKGAISQKQSSITGDYLEWFTLELATELSLGLLSEMLEKKEGDDTKPLEHYKSFIEEVQRQKPHDLSKDVERALTVRSPYTGTRPVVSFLDKELARMKFDLQGESVNIEVLLSKLSSSKDASVRAQCMQSLNDGLGDSIVRIAALSLSSVSGSWLIENQERKYKTLRSRRNLDNNCPDSAVESLLQGVRSEGVTLCKRYYTLKKNILRQTQALEDFRWSDRNAPLDIVEKEDEQDGGDKISWEKAVEMVERGYRKFSPRMAEMFMGMVKEQRIDVPAVDHKKGGAYCAGVIPGVGPFQLLNFDGTKHDVATLAHESGHGCHDILAYQQGYLQYHPPLTLAETASIFGEMIVFRDLLDLAKTPAERLTLLMSKIDDVVNSVVRQCSFDRFEELAHSARDKGELSAEELTSFWKQAVEEYYGKARDEGGDSPFDSYQDISNLWSYVPHFHHVPFYVYSYAFADLVVGTLYNSFLQTPDGFEDRLIDLLSAGGTRDFATALQPFGLDPSSPSFWEDALRAHLGGLIEEAEAVAKVLGYAA